jgi:lycopene cyclase CruA
MMRVPEAVVERGGAELGERLLALERSRSTGRSKERDVAAPKTGEAMDADVLIAGGGLSLLLAPALAKRGLSVMVADRGTVGAVHREWNVSEDELPALVESGVFDASEVEDLVLNRYRYGNCRWHEGGVYPVQGVLDHALDAKGLLSLARAKASRLGVDLMDRTSVLGAAGGAEGVRVLLAREDGREETVNVRLMIDARGAASPHATADIVCPTVGGVMEGTSLPHDVGEILATIDHCDDGRQHLWEAFPGREGQVTVYVFYYARSGSVPSGGLIELYERFFRQVESFTGGTPSLATPTFGYIPGWSRLSKAPSTPHPRICLFGDAAARHSPLTFCGFGSMIRTFGPAAVTIADWLEGGETGPLDLFPNEPIHGFTGPLSRILTRPSRNPAGLNRLLDAAFGTLHGMGEDPYRSLLKDRMDAASFRRFLWRTSLRRPSVYLDVAGGLEGDELLWWSQLISRTALASVRDVLKGGKKNP